MAERSLAFVVQRYGAEVVGGSESLCRVIAEMMSSYGPVDVLTSCADDYITWRDTYPAGRSSLNGVTVRRFPVDFERPQAFNEVMGAILGGLPLSAYDKQKSLMRAAIARSSTEQQLTCLKLQGPYSTPLLSYLAERSRDYDLVVFFTYLYATTFYGSQKTPAAKTVLVPTAHDEAPIFFPVFRNMFARFPAYIFLTIEERRFMEEAFDIDEAIKTTAGMPVELPATPDADRFRANYGINEPFVLYAGRLDPSKGCDELLAYFRAARGQLPEHTKLVLIGSRAMDIPADRDVLYLGMLSEQDKVDAMAAASVFVNPSRFESFSIVVLEAMLCGTPVLVNGISEVLRGHVLRSRAGLYYQTAYEFVEAIRLLLGDGELRQRLGRNGMSYVAANYSLATVKKRYLTFFARAQAVAELERSR